MDSSIIQLISNVGFPIVAFLLVYFDLSKKIDRVLDAVEKLCLKL